MKEFEARFFYYSDGGVFICTESKDPSTGESIDITDWLSSALDRYGYALVEACVPDEVNEESDDIAIKMALVMRNQCRATTLTKAREITNQ